MKPLLSVILPVYNGEKFLADALRSILLQDACPLEIIVVDDGSTDRTPDIALAFGTDVRYIRQSNAGPAAARNTGLAEARGDYLGFIDADDIWPESKVESQLGVLAEDQQLDAVLGMTKSILPNGRLGEARFFMQIGCGLYRRAAFDNVGGFDSTLPFSEDIDWFTRAREAGLRLQVTKDVTLHYRLHEHNSTRGTNVYDLGYLRIIKRSLDRRRSRAGGEPIDLAPLTFVSGRQGT